MAFAQLLDPLEDRQTGVDRPLGVFRPSERRAEDGHHGVADVLLDDAPVPLDP